MILAIDPGPEKSAFTRIDAINLKPLDFGIIGNEELIEGLIMGDFDRADNFAIEMVASYGMAVGKDVFETCVWIGRFWQASGHWTKQLIYRMEVKNNLCHSSRANDSNIRQALIDRFGPVGTKRNPGWFYGFKTDIWSAYAVAVTYYDLYLNKIREVASG
jgi:hypothetical protein